MVRAVRKRYVAFLVEPPQHPPLVERAVLAVVERVMPSALRDLARPRLFHLRPGAAIVRCEPSTQRALVAALQGLRAGEGQVRTVTTSGTLRQAKAALGVRQSARRRPKQARAQPGGRTGSAPTRSTSQGPRRGRGRAGAPSGRNLRPPANP